MRLLLTTDTVGGVWTFTRELTGELLNRGHAVALVSFGREPNAAQLAVAAEFRARFPEHFRYSWSAAPLEWMAGNAESLEEPTALLLRVAAEFSPDLLHTNQFCFGALPLPLPKLITAHSDVLSWAEVCRPSGLEPSPWLYRYRQLVAAGLFRADRLVTPTRWMLHNLQRHIEILPPASVIPNGRSVPPCDPETGRHLQAVTVGRLWDEGKNIALLGLVESPLPIRIAGESSLDGSSAPAQLGEATLLGPLNERDTLHLFCNSSIYIATSKYEPFGLAPLEAALCGCAVLCNDIPSLREVWGPGALYFHSAASLTALLRELTAYPEALQAARDRSAARAGEYTSARMAESYLAVYDDLLASAAEPLPPIEDLPQHGS